VDIVLYGQFVLALLVVLALIGVLAMGAKRLGFGPRVTPRRGRRRLAIIEVMALDAKRRLVLVQRDDTEHLLLLGATQDSVIESGIPAATVDATPDPTIRPSDSR
jgi:flagellar protein FliO/FliZ